MTLAEEAFKNIVRKGKMLVTSNVFLSHQRKFVQFYFLPSLKLSSAISVNLDKAYILSSFKGLKPLSCYIS